MTKKICFFGNFTAGGTEKVTLLLANKLICRYIREYNIIILNIRNKQLSFPLSDKIQYKILTKKRLFAKIVELRTFIKRERIDLLVNVEVSCGIYSILGTFLLCKMITWEHANYYQTQNVRWLPYLRKILLYISDCYVVLTKRDLRNFRKNEKIKCPLVQIYNPLETINWNIAYNPNSKNIVSAGHIRPIKNFCIIPELFTPIAAKYPEWKWLIYGESVGAEYEKLKKLINEFHLENNIILKGRANNLNEIFKNASIYVLTSLQEGLPTVLLEAKIFDVPIVSFDIETGPDEIVCNNKNGFLIPAYNINIMRESILALIDDKELRMSFSKCSKYDTEKFNVDLCLNKWIDLFDNIIKS